MANTHSSHSYDPALSAWSIIASPSSEEEDRETTLVKLGIVYFYPIFAHLRDLGHPSTDAFDFASGFIQKLVTGLAVSQPQERFRSYLYARLKEFCDRPSPANVPLGSIPKLEDVERRYGVEGTLSADLHDAFEQRYVRELMMRTMTRLRDEAAHNGKHVLFEKLVDYLTVEPTTQQSQQLAQTLNISPLALTIALKRLRARYAEIGLEELAHTVLDPAEIESERSTIHTILR